MVGHFWMGRWDGLAWAAALVGAGILAHVVNVALSVRGLARWFFTARGVALALGGLTLTVAFGVTLAMTHGAHVFPGGLLGAVHAHFHLALLGWVAPMIVAVAARVYPMFLLAPEPGGWAPPSSSEAWASACPPLSWGSCSGGPRWWRRAPSRSRWRSGFTRGGSWALPGGGSGLTLDWGLRFVLTGTACLAPLGALGLAFALGVGSGPRVALAYAVLALGGWVSLTIVGMMLEIVPFLVCTASTRRGPVTSRCPRLSSSRGRPPSGSPTGCSPPGHWLSPPPWRPASPRPSRWRGRS